MRRALFVLWYPHVMYIHTYPRRHWLVGSAVVTLAGCALFVCRRRLCGGTCLHRPSGSNNQKSNGKYRVGIPGPYQVPTGMQMTSNDTWPWQQIARWQVCYSCSETLPCESRFNQSLLIQDFPQWAVDRTTSLPGESTTQRLNGGSGDTLKREFLRHGLLGHMDRNETKDIRWAFDYWQSP